uniref:Pectin acetylesterase n=1 Tax=Fagus sylvatica TaxID=28930 RepID=A0A2N9I1B5_FAGSY
MSNSKLRALTWWRKWTKKDWAVAAVGFSVIVFLFTLMSNSWSHDVDDSKVNHPFDHDHDHDHTRIPDLVDLTLSHNAKDRGAFCLDGSLPGYHFQKGFGSGSNNWLLHMEGGGWCNSIASCSSRKLTALGSSKYMERQVPFNGILSPHPSQNPDFFNWNKVKIRYCDGASFAGHPESELKNETGLFFRGQLIWEALMDELLSVGLSKAKQALLSGCSAGGLATLIHCDDFRELLPKDATVKCLADAGFFLDEVLQKACTRIVLQEWNHQRQCLFPQEIVKKIKTPVFLVNPAYDFWQIQNILIPVASDPHGYWRNCRLSIHNCNPSQLDILQDSIASYCLAETNLSSSVMFRCFRNSLLRALSEFQKIKEGGMFINSCFVHCQTWMAETWHSAKSPRLNKKTIAESVGDWFFNRKAVKQIDCPYPCNPTCYNLDFT